jgi:hypothetical protein
MPWSEDHGMASSPEKSAAARRVLAERARRISALRRRVVAGAVAAFVMAWGVIAWTGSMGTDSAASAAATTSTTTSSSTQSTTQDEPSAVTTGQS